MSYVHFSAVCLQVWLDEVCDSLDEEQNQVSPLDGEFLLAQQLSGQHGQMLLLCLTTTHIIPSKILFKNKVDTYLRRAGYK